MALFGNSSLILVSDLDAGSPKLNNLRLKHMDAIKGVFTGLSTFINPSEIATSPLWKQAAERKLEIHADSVNWYFTNKKQSAIRELRSRNVLHFFLDDANVLLSKGFDIPAATAYIQELGGIPVISCATKSEPQMTPLAMKNYIQTEYQLYRQDAGAKDVHHVDDWIDDLPMSWAAVECFKDDSGKMTTKEAFVAMMDLYIKKPNAPRNLRLYASDENTKLLDLAIWPTVLAKFKEWRNR